MAFSSILSQPVQNHRKHGGIEERVSHFGNSGAGGKGAKTRSGSGLGRVGRRGLRHQFFFSVEGFFAGAFDAGGVAAEQSGRFCISSTSQMGFSRVVTIFPLMSLLQLK